MEFKEAMRIWTRMCEAQKECELCGLCDDCPGADGFSDDYDAHSVEAILAKWAAEHPEKTIADDFFEKHPKAKKKNDDDFPIVCAVHCGYVDKCPYSTLIPDCARCWRRPLEEVE